MVTRCTCIRFLSLAAALSCGGAPKSIAPTTDSWSAQSWEEHHMTMTFTVLPNMARTWRDFEGKTDADMTCVTCHGKDAESIAYKMPSKELLALDPAHMPRPDASDPHVAKMARFMTEKVVPEMIDLTGASRSTFGCFNCHPKAHR